MKLAMFDENGQLKQYVYVNNLEDIDSGENLILPDGWTLRDGEGQVVELPAPRNELDEINERLTVLILGLEQLRVDLLKLKENHIER